MVHRDNPAGQPGGVVGQNMKGAFVMSVDAVGKKLPDLNRYAELFFKFPGQSGFRCFAGLDFASGKFPLPRKPLRGFSSGDQNLRIVNHKCRGNFNHSA